MFSCFHLHWHPNPKQDFDLCAPCERLDYFESGLGRAADSGVRFLCPYAPSHCAHPDPRSAATTTYTELGLLAHVSQYHAAASTFVTCPVCEVNGNRAAIMSQPRFGEHLAQDHCRYYG